MTTVSGHFGIAGGQPVLDFVDVPVRGDAKLFLDPRALKELPDGDDWARGWVGLLQDFFARVLATVQAGDRAAGVKLLAGLQEPNETHLGFSQGRSRGSGVGTRLANELWTALSNSRAAQSGLLADLEEAALLVDAVSDDRVSDIATNVLRRPLIDYTQAQAALHGLPTEQVAAGRLWDPEVGRWTGDSYVQLPVGPDGPLLLIPKAIVRKRPELNADEYYRHHILSRYRDDELAAGRGMVRVLKDGREEPYLSKLEADKRLLARRTTRKRANAALTTDDDQLLRQYLSEKARGVRRSGPLSDEDLSAATGAPLTDWSSLLDSVTKTPTGPATATHYHHAVRDLLSALFVPELGDVRTEEPVHQGRKRVDLRFTNRGEGGFFAWMQKNYPPQPFVWAECKNYAGDIANDALDQLTGRFAAQGRGNIGLQLCRSFADKPAFIRRCRDAASDGRGWVIVLDDHDLVELVALRSQGGRGDVADRLRSRFGELVS